MNILEEYNYTYNKLIELNFNFNSSGIIYWMIAIKRYKTEVDKFKFSVISMYKEIADELNVNWMQVERNMRSAVKPYTKECISKKYNYYNKLNTKTIIKLIGGF